MTGRGKRWAENERRSGLMGIGGMKECRGAKMSASRSWRFATNAAKQ